MLAVGVDAGAVTREIPTLLGVPRPVRLLEPLGIAPDAAQHRRPRLVQHQIARHMLGLVGTRHQLLAVLVDDLRGDTRQRRHRGTGLCRRHAGQRRDHDRAGLGLPPGVHDRSSVAAEGVPVPSPRLRVDRLADRTQQPQAGKIVGVGNLASPLHEHPDQRRRRVIDCDAVLFDDLEMPVLVGRVRCAFVDHLGDAVGQRPVDDVRVAGDPADIRCAPEDVGLRLDVEDVVMRVGRLRQIATRGVHDALGLAGGARRVEQEQRVLGVERLRSVLG